MLDKFHRNKKITECVSDKEIAENLRNFLFQNRFDELLVCIEAYINSSEDEREKAKLQELYRYYSENKEALAGYRDRGISIPQHANRVKFSTLILAVWKVMCLLLSATE